MNLSTRNKSEVELRVAQELKNNQDFIYQTNQEIQKLNFLFNALLKEMEDVRADQGVHLSNYESLINELQTKSAENLKQCKAALADIMTMLEKHKKEISKQIAQIEKDYSSNDTVVNCFAIFKLANEGIMQEIEEVKKLNESNHNAIHRKIDQTSNDLKNQLTPIVPEIDPLWQFINEKMEVFNVNFEGIKLDIERAKRAIFYGEKKFENIYTLIERLKAGQE